MRAIPYLLPVFITAIFVSCVYGGTLWVGPLLLPAFGLLHLVLGRFSKEELLSEYAYFHHEKGPALVRTISGFFFVGFNAWIAIYLYQHALTAWELAIFVYSVIILNSNFAISLAHELMHSSRPTDRLLATTLLLINGFFYLESDHLFIHHRFVGTERDPASAYPGEGLYHYLLRSIPKRAVMILGKSKTFPDEKAGHIIRANYLKLVVCLALLVLAAISSHALFIWLLAQYIFVTLIYEVITYIQHYGLRRGIDSLGTPEPVGLHHSWSCNYRLSAYLYYMMPVHAIHHLRHEPELESMNAIGPIFPYSFTKMVTLALVPPRWFKVMGPTLLKVNSDA